MAGVAELNFLKSKCCDEAAAQRRDYSLISSIGETQFPGAAPTQEDLEFCEGIAMHCQKQHVSVKIPCIAAVCI